VRRRPCPAPGPIGGTPRAESARGGPRSRCIPRAPRELGERSFSRSAESAGRHMDSPGREPRVRFGRRIARRAPSEPRIATGPRLPVAGGRSATDQINRCSFGSRGSRPGLSMCRPADSPDQRMSASPALAAPTPEFRVARWPVVRRPARPLDPGVCTPGYSEPSFGLGRQADCRRARLPVTPLSRVAECTGLVQSTGPSSASARSG
jgi:hypothetical protein